MTCVDGQPQAMAAAQLMSRMLKQGDQVWAPSTANSCGGGGDGGGILMEPSMFVLLVGENTAWWCMVQWSLKALFVWGGDLGGPWGVTLPCWILSHACWPRLLKVGSKFNCAAFWIQRNSDSQKLNRWFWCEIIFCCICIMYMYVCLYIYMHICIITINLVMDMWWMEVLLNPAVLDMRILCWGLSSFESSTGGKRGGGVVLVVTQKAELEWEVKATKPVNKLG